MWFKEKPKTITVEINDEKGDLIADAHKAFEGMEIERLFSRNFAPSRLTTEPGIARLVMQEVRLVNYPSPKSVIVPPEKMQAYDELLEWCKNKPEEAAARISRLELESGNCAYCEPLSK